MATKLKNAHPSDPQGPMVTLEAALQLIRDNVSEWIWLHNHLEENGGFLKLNPHRFKRFQLADLPYGKFFSHPLAPVLAAISPICSPKEFQNLCQDIEDKSLEERSSWLASDNEFKTEFDDFANLALPEPGTLSFADLRQIVAEIKRIERLPPEKRHSIVRASITFQCGVIACFYEFAAVGITGRKMTSLVAAAVDGCHDSFATAVAMIPRLTSDNEDMRRTHSMMQLDPNLAELKQKVSSRQKAPPFASRIKDKALWISLCILDGLNLLGRETSRQDIFDGLETIGVIPDDEEKYSVTTLNRAIGRYRKRQQDFTIR